MNVERPGIWGQSQPNKPTTNNVYYGQSAFGGQGRQNPSKLLQTGLGPWSFLRIIRKLTLRRDFGHSRTRKRLSQIPRQELSELPLHYNNISIILKRSSAHLCARAHVPPCLALGQGPHPAQLLGADAARGFWRWWLQSRRSRCRRWWLR